MDRNRVQSPPRAASGGCGCDDIERQDQHALGVVLGSLQNRLEGKCTKMHSIQFKMNGHYTTGCITLQVSGVEGVAARES